MRNIARCNLLKSATLALLMASSALATETNTFTFTNKAGTIFENARLIKVENGEAVVIAGTIGARVKMEELPLEVQARCAFDEMAAKPKAAEKLPDGLKVDIFQDGGRRETAMVSMTNSTGVAFLTFTRATEEGKTAACHAVVSLDQKMGSEPDGPLIFTADGFEVSGMAYVRKDSEEISGFIRRTGLLLYLSDEDVIRICRARVVEVTVGVRGSEGPRFRFVPDSAHKMLAGIVAAGLQRQRAAVPLEGGMAATEASMRVVDSNGTFTTYAWKFTARNNGPAAKGWFKIQFLDSAGFELEHSLAEVELPGGGAKTVTGSRLVRNAVASQIRRVTVTKD